VQKNVWAPDRNTKGFAVSFQSSSQGVCSVHTSRAEQLTKHPRYQRSRSTFEKRYLVEEFEKTTPTICQWNDHKLLVLHFVILYKKTFVYTYTVCCNV